MRLPDLPNGYSWQLCRDGRDRTGDLDYRDADEIRIWHETGDLALAMKTLDTRWEVVEGVRFGRVVYLLDDAVALAGLTGSPKGR